MTYTAQTIPTSFTGKALLMGATSFYTPEIGQNALDRWIVSPCQFVARVIYLLVVGLFIAPIGALYHAIAGIYHEWSRAKGCVEEHFNAAFQDLTSITGLRHLRFCVKPHRAVSSLFSTTEIKISKRRELKYPYNEVIAVSLSIREAHGMSQLPNYHDKRVIPLLDQMRCHSGHLPSTFSPEEKVYVKKWQASQSSV